MKKLLTTTLLAIVFGGASFSARAQDQREKVVIAEGTRARLTLQTPLSSRLSESGDEITAVLTQAVRDAEGRIALPRGAEFTGRIAQVQPARRLHRDASMTIVFETVRLAHGVEKVSVLVTAIDDLEGYQKLKADQDGRKVNGGHSPERTARNAAVGGQAGLLGGLAGGFIVGSGPGTITAMRVGLGVGIIGSILLTKGNEIILAPDTIFRIRFESPLTLPAAAPEPPR